jgi:hypothetical protein
MRRPCLLLAGSTRVRRWSGTGCGGPSGCSADSETGNVSQCYSNGNAILAVLPVPDATQTTA